MSLWLGAGFRSTAFAAALLITAARSTYGLDVSKVTCQTFLASGQSNIAAMLMFLRGYHAGKTGVVPYDSSDRYAARLGFYCRQHPQANLIEASESILAELSRGL